MNTVVTKGGTTLPIQLIKGKQYLNVAYRLVWFREENPNWSIETEFISMAENSAIAKAIIKNDKGVIAATAHKHETKEGFPDFLEKAETGAIGRALALCGYGTQFTDDLDEGDRLAESPIVSAKTQSPFDLGPASRTAQKKQFSDNPDVGFPEPIKKGKTNGPAPITDFD